jgi:sec-independent protein translocase protein TatA
MLAFQILGLRTPELLLIVAAIFLLFGASRLPQLAKSLGQSRKAFKEALRESEEQDSVSVAEPRKQITRNAASTLSDEEILAEMQRRANVQAKV